MKNYLSFTLALLLPVSGAHAFSLCAAAKNGVIKEGADIHLRTSCKTNEVTLPISIENGNALVRITGANVQIVDGSGDTGGDPNGRGNLIVGYNEETPGDPNVRTGSRNVIVGQEHSYSSTGGVVGGYGNRITNEGTVAFGQFSQASGIFAVVSGGLENVASGPRAAVSGGTLNSASGDPSSVSGGRANDAAGTLSSITSGDDNNANGTFASVTGGRSNAAIGDGSTVSGGFERVVPEANNWAAGALLEAQ